MSVSARRKTRVRDRGDLRIPAREAIIDSVGVRTVCVRERGGSRLSGDVIDNAYPGKQVCNMLGEKKGRSTNVDHFYVTSSFWGVADRANHNLQKTAFNVDM